MKPDPTIRDLFEALLSVPRRLLDVRLSTIARPALVVVFVTACVGIAVLLGKIVSYWWPVPNYVYGIVFVLAPLRYLIHSKDSKAEKLVAILLMIAAVASYEYYASIKERNAEAEMKQKQEKLEHEKSDQQILQLLQEATKKQPPAQKQ